MFALLERDCLSEERSHFRRKFAVVEPVRPQVEVIGRGHGRGTGSLGQAQAGDQPELERVGDLFDDLVLQRENLAPGAIEALRPEMATAGRVDELGVDAQVGRPAPAGRPCPCR